MSNNDDSDPAAELSSPARRDLVVCIVLTILSFIVYLKTMCPTIFTDDCGEIATAVATGGVIHPPGYPLYALLGSVLIRLIPFGEPAWRLGFLSAIPASLAVSLTYKLTRRLGAGIAWSVCAALAFAFSVALWQQATKVETYALNAFFVALIFNRAAQYYESGSRRDLMILALICGLSLTNHLTIICTLVPALWLISAALKRDPKPVIAIVQAIPFLVAPLSLYSLLWIAATAHPGGQIWGDPSNAHRFWLHVTGARYHPYFFRDNGPEMAQRDLINLPAALWHNLGLFLIALVPGVGRSLWVSGSRRLSISLLICASLYLFETTVYGILNIFEYYTPLMMILCVFCGVGMDAIVVGVMKKLNAPRAELKTLQTSLCALIGVVALITHWTYCDRSQSTYIRNMALDTLNTLPSNAVLITAGDNQNFPMWYAQDVLHVREDVTIIPRVMSADLKTADTRDEMNWMIYKLSVNHPEIVDSRAIIANSISNPQYASEDHPVWDCVARALILKRPVFMAGCEPGDVRLGGSDLPILTMINPTMVLSPVGIFDQIVPFAHEPDLIQRIKTNLAVESKLSFDYAPPEQMEDEPDGAITNAIYSSVLRRNADMLIKVNNPQGAYGRLVTACRFNPTASNKADLAYVAGLLGKQTEQISLLKQAVQTDGSNDDYVDALFSAEKMAAIGADDMRASR